MRSTLFKRLMEILDGTYRDADDPDLFEESDAEEVWEEVGHQWEESVLRPFEVIDDEELFDAIRDWQHRKFSS